MRLDIYVFCSEKLLCPFYGDIFYDIDKFASPIPPSAWVAFGVLINHGAGLGFDYGAACEILACYELQFFVLALGFV